MGIRERQYRYGALFGIAAFGAGLLLTHLTIPPEAIPDVERWRSVTWLYLNAHGVPIFASGFDASQVTLHRVRGAQASSFIPLFSAVPVLVSAIGSLLTIEAVGYTTRPRYLLENSAWFLPGYVLAAATGIAVSGALPGIPLFMTVLVIAGVALYLGSVLVDRLTAGLPVIAFVSLGSVLLVGLLVMVAGLVVVSALAPIAFIGVIGCLAAAGGAYIART